LHAIKLTYVTDKLYQISPKSTQFSFSIIDISLKTP